MALYGTISFFNHLEMFFGGWKWAIREPGARSFKVAGDDSATRPPLWKIGLRQLGWWLDSQYFWENKIHGNQTTNQWFFFTMIPKNRIYNTATTIRMIDSKTQNDDGISKMIGRWAMKNTPIPFSPIDFWRWRNPPNQPSGSSEDPEICFCQSSLRPSRPPA